MSFNLRKRTYITHYKPAEQNVNDYEHCESNGVDKPSSSRSDITERKQEKLRAVLFKDSMLAAEQLKTSVRKLRQRPRVSYYEPEEPSFDQYIYCEECADYVFEYCAIHGPLLVVPDDKPSSKPKVPAIVPRAALTIPHVFLHLAPSIIPGAGIGVFSTLTLPRGVRFGPYRGQRAQSVDSMYCWQIYDADNRRAHVLDAADPQRSNWMRYVNCARRWPEQNLVAYQYRGQLYYRTIKIIPRFTELLVYYGSEFANALRVNLKEYNSARYYKDVIIAGAPCVINQEPDSNSSTGSTSSTSNTPPNNEQIIDTVSSEELLNFNDFQIIDDDSNTQSQESFIESNTLTLNFNDFVEPKFMHAVENIQFNNLNTDQTRFQCDKCNKSFAKKKYLRCHYQRHSETPKYQCEECSYNTSNKYAFTRHCLSHANRQTYACKLCSFKTDIKSHFVSHIFQHNLPNGVITSASYYSKLKQCEFCEYNTYSRKSFQTHISKHRGIVHQCQQCEYNSYSKANLNQHLLRKHGYKK